MCEWGLTGSLLPMKFIANTDAEVAPNARPLVAPVPANHLITKVAPNARPLAHLVTKVAPNARPLVAPVPANHLITKVAPNACPLIASPQITPSHPQGGIQ